MHRVRLVCVGWRQQTGRLAAAQGRKDAATKEMPMRLYNAA